MMEKAPYPRRSKYEIVTSEFVMSNTDIARCPSDGRPEYAFIGRSNVGKSSLINMRCGRKQLALTAARPGTTMLINHFIIDGKCYIVDLPGYGYARRSKSDVARLKEMIDSYVYGRTALTCLFVLVDSRVPPQPVDLEFINSLGEHGVPVAIVFTKADKAGDKATRRNIDDFLAALSEHWEELPPVFVTSALRKTGREELLKYIHSVNVSIAQEKSQNSKS